MADSLRFRTLLYGPDGVDISDFVTPEMLRQPGRICWVDVTDLSRKDEIGALCRMGGLHRLIAEDILDTGQMVKLDNYDDCLFLVLKMLDYNRCSSDITTGHVGIVLKGRCVFSFQENDGDIFARVRDHILTGREGVRAQGPDFLCYELIDTVVDNCFTVLDDLGDVADELEEELIARPDRLTLSRIYFVKRKLMFLRKSVFPLRTLIGNLIRTGSPLIGDGVRIYFHDIYDHLVQIADSIETYQDILSNMLDTFLSSISNRTNDTMKILTIFSTIFIPLTFLAGIYGMNFKNIPELSMPYGYVLFWVISLIIAVVMLLFFHHKKWL